MNHLVHIGDACTPTHEAGLAQLWRVQGLVDVLYPSKTAAEVAARLSFPGEGPDERYARISYTLYVPQP